MTQQEDELMTDVYGGVGEGQDEEQQQHQGFGVEDGEAR